MSKIGLIIGREYSSRVRKRSFIIMTFLGPVLFAAVIIGAVMAVTNDTTFHQVVVVDETGLAETTVNKAACSKILTSCVTALQAKCRTPPLPPAHIPYGWK